MMSLTDPVDAQLELAKQEVDNGLEDALRSATIAGVLSLMPGVGSAIQSLLDGKARQNVDRRWLELFVEMRKRIEEIRSLIPDVAFYASEEFQTLLALAHEQLWTTHDKEKLHLLATALANSGIETFQKDDKDPLIRVLRTLSPADVKNLNHEYLKGWVPLIRKIDYAPEVLASLSRLASAGLVLETPIPPDPNMSESARLGRSSKMAPGARSDCLPSVSASLISLETVPRGQFPNEPKI